MRNKACLAAALFVIAVLLATSHAADERVRLDAVPRPALELRIVATPHQHAAIIQAAQAQQRLEERSGQVWAAGVVDPKNPQHEIARWVVVVDHSPLVESPNCVVRKTSENGPTGKPRAEVLVVMGPDDITSADVAEASESRDSTGRPTVSIVFSTAGAKRMEALSSKHLPGPDGEAFQLGIIVRGVLQSAPRLQSTISEQAQITGNFTQEEVRSLVDALNGKRTAPRTKDQ